MPRHPQPRRRRRPGSQGADVAQHARERGSITGQHHQGKHVSRSQHQGPNVTRVGKLPHQQRRGEQVQGTDQRQQRRHKARPSPDGNRGERQHTAHHDHHPDQPGHQRPRVPQGQRRERATPALSRSAAFADQGGVDGAQASHRMEGLRRRKEFRSQPARQRVPRSKPAETAFYCVAKRPTPKCVKRPPIGRLETSGHPAPVGATCRARMASAGRSRAGRVAHWSRRDRRWLHGRDDIAACFRQLTPMLSDVHSEISDVRKTMGAIPASSPVDRAGYTLDGTATHIFAPTMMVLRQEAGDEDRPWQSPQTVETWNVLELRFRSLLEGAVLAGVNATPFGWPAASLDPIPGAARRQRAGRPVCQGIRITNLQSLRFIRK